MDQSRQLALLIRPYGDHKAPIPLGDDVVLQNLGIAGGRDDLLQDLPAFCQRRPHVTANVRQLRAGGVGHGVLVADAPPDLILQEPIAVDGQENLVKGGRLCRVGVEILLGPAGGVQQIADPDQLRDVEAAAPVRPVQQVLYRLDAGKTRRPSQDDHGPCAVGLIQQAQHVLIICFRPDRQCQLLGLRADRLLRQ